MHPIIIVEDKKITREGLVKMVDWNSIGGQAVAGFDCGNAAIDYLSAHKVDLIVTDIAMENGSGLDLLRYVSEKAPETKVIILSAYEKFSYAQEALSMGASAYLLKPVDTKKLLTEARRAFDSFENTDQIKSQQSLLKWGMAGDALSRCLTEPESEDAAASASDSLQKLGSDFETVRSRILYFQVYRNSALSCQRLRDQANIHHLPVIVFPVGNCYCAILSGTYPASDSSLHELMGEWNLHPPYRMAVSAPSPDGYASWKDCFKQARRIFAASFWQNTPPGIYSDSDLTVPSSTSQAIHLDYAKLKKDLFSNNLEDAGQHIEETLNTCTEGNCTIQSVTGNFEETMQWLADSGSCSFDASSFHNQIKECSSRDALLNLTAAELKSLFEEAAEHRSKTIRPIVQLVLEYAIKHIDEPDLNLKFISEKLGVSYVYLSKAFKEDIHEGFSKYISSYRIELAKDYLKDPHIHAYEVCEKVGLELKNFHGLFKKYTGMTPKTWQAQNIHH
ncbi:MAG: response regulator transcription factor [Lachnospiraceae bacterium]|jgi:two-component system response regulator YesN